MSQFDRELEGSPGFESESEYEAASPLLNPNNEIGADFGSQHLETVFSPQSHSEDNNESEDGSSDSQSHTVPSQLSEREVQQRRRWQAEEIRLATSLHAQEAGDLNQNLYKLGKERRSRQTHARPPDVAAWQSRYRWVDSKSATSALPPSDWASWPLEPHEVPLPDEWFDNPKFGSPTYRPLKKRKLTKPSAELEEILCDIALQKCRRRWDFQTRPSHTKMKEPETRSLQSEEDVGMPIQTEYSANSTYSSVTSASASIPESINTELPSHTDLTRSEFPSKLKNKGGISFQKSKHPLQPVFSADDERSYRILQPSVRRIMSSIDILLAGMYHSRINQDKANSYVDSLRIGLRKEWKSSGQQSGSNLEFGVGAESSKTRGRRSAKEEHINAPHGRDSHSPPGSRDWSELLGIAALTGWDPNAVKRAAKRCAKLFGEDMSFSTLREDETADQIEPVLVSLGAQWLPHASDSRESKPKDTIGGIHVDGFMQPILGRQGWRGKDKSKSETRGKKRRKDGNITGKNETQSRSVDGIDDSE